MKKIYVFLMFLILFSLLACNNNISTINITDLQITTDIQTEPSTTLEITTDPITTIEPTTVEPTTVEPKTTESTTTPVLESKYNTPNNVYTLDLILDTETDSLSVQGEIYYKNDDYDLDELYLTLYPNAKNDSERMDNVVIEYITIDDINYDFEIDSEDHSQIHIDLNETLTKGRRISIEFEYTFSYWQDMGRISEHENEYLTMFFYPYVAVFDEDGWNLEPYTFQGEAYYNTIGDYYVNIDTPNTYSVAASGKLMETLEIESRHTYVYEIKNARDFSFSASKDYSVYTQIEDDRVYQIYSLVGLTEMSEYRVFSIIKNTFNLLESTIGEYPYDHYTLELGEYYGMESTGIAYCSYEINEETIVHEIIHQWFYSMVGNDQSDESFVDEAITTYLTSLYFYDKSGVYGYNDYLNFRDSLAERFEERILLNQGVSLLQKVDEMGDQYGYLIYYHGPTMFRYYVDEFLEGDMDMFYDILSDYFEQYQYKEASLDDLLDVIESESEIDITKEWFMMQIESFQSLDHRPE
jgi:RNAse (barnase) inhibitor barstar